ncbi:MAG: putative polysaccharide biosynthesis protein [Bacillota bacterium]|jgi:stage V sporulation protein B
MKKEGLLYGAIVLLVSNFLIKFLGFFYRVVLVRIIGTEGIGLVEMVLPIYTFVLVIATWGIPLAMSKLIAEETARENYGNIHKTFTLTLFLLTTSGTICTLAVYWLSPYIFAYFTADRRIFLCFMTMIPAIFIIAICSAFRAYYQGMKQVSVIGVSQTIEQTVRVIVGITLAIKLKKYGLEIAVTAVALATVLGELSGLIYMIGRYYAKPRIQKSTPNKGSWFLFKSLLGFGTPVTLTRLLSSFLLTMQASLIPKGLMLAGNDLRTATELYGRFSGVALTLLHLPGTLTMSVAVSIIPAVAELMSKKNHQLLTHRVSEALQITTVFSLPGMLVLFFYPQELCSLIFHSPEAGAPLKILAFGGVFLYLQQILTSILQGMGCVKTLLLNMVCSGFFLIGGILLLTPLPLLGINGAAIALSVSFFVGSMLNFYYLIKNARLSLPYANILLKPFAAFFVSLIVMYFTDHWLRYKMLEEIPIILISVSLALIIYFLFLFFYGGLPQSTLKRFPILKYWF